MPGFNPNALSDEEYYAIMNDGLLPGESWATPEDVLSLFYAPPNLRQVVSGAGVGFDPNGLSDADYYVMQQQYLNPGGGVQQYYPPRRYARPARPAMGGFTPAPYNPAAPENMGTPYGPPMMMPIMIQPPAGWAPTAYAPNNRYYG